MTLVNLNYMLGTKVINLDLFVMGARGHTTAQGVELCLVDDSTVLLVSLDGLFCVQVPDYYLFIIAGDHIGGGWGKLTVSHPVLVTFKGELQSPVYCRPYFDQFVVSTGREE